MTGAALKGPSAAMWFHYTTSPNIARHVQGKVRCIIASPNETMDFVVESMPSYLYTKLLEGVFHKFGINCA
jgi:hypothetical protein